MAHHGDPLGALSELETPSGPLSYWRLGALQDGGIADLDLLPVTIKVLVENLLRLVETGVAEPGDPAWLAGWGRSRLEEREFPFSPARVILQDFTGVPAVVDLAAMRSAIARAGGDPARIDPLVPVDLVVDHSVQVDAFGTATAFRINVDREYERNRERYTLLRWAQQAFAGFRVVPPGMGIVHQVNLEYLGTVVRTLEGGRGAVAVPDTLVGTDSHTTMINGLGILGWGVGGIEAEAAMLGQPLPMVTPRVTGFRFTGALAPGVTATDLVLTVTEMLRAHGVVGKFVEFYGAGLSSLSVADRATISNMCPEYGATASLFPVDAQTLDYLRLTGRDERIVDLVERYTKAQGMFRTDDGPEPHFSERLELDLGDVEPSVAGPRRPQDRVPLAAAPASFAGVYGTSSGRAEVDLDGATTAIEDGSIVIAAITSCTNTSNPSVMIGAGLLARNAVERGLAVKPWVKTSLAPGSRVVTEYLERSGLTPYLEKLGFYVVGYGCTTCIGNSGPLPEPIGRAIDDHDITAVSVLSGNRNFEGRIHPQVKASYLASPPLVVAYALAGHISVDLTSEPIGRDPSGEPVYLSELWPAPEEIAAALDAVASEMFTTEYGRVFEGEDNWRELPSPQGSLYDWDPGSTYVQEPPFFADIGPEPAPVDDIAGARVLALCADSVTTDHISPAGAIAPASPAGKHLISLGVQPLDFNSYGARRGNHEVMMRGTFANIRFRNLLAAPHEGGWSVHLSSGETDTLYDVAMRYLAEGTPTVIIAGREYGSGSSRDWAAKGPRLLGVRAVMAESFERIHRSNLVGMGVLPLEFTGGDGASSLGLDGTEVYDIAGISSGLQPRALLPVVARRADGSEITFEVRCRIDSEVELDYYRHGGVLQYVLRRMLAP